MIEGLKPYVEYKESGLPWLQAIPSHWQTTRNGNLFQQRNDTQFPDLPLLEVSLRTGVRVRDFGASKRKQVMADAAKYKRAAAGDVAYNMMRMWQGAVGVAPVDGLVSPAYVVARPFEGTEAHYYTALFRNGLYMGEIDAASRGIVKDRNRLYWGQFKQMRSLLPPPDEQAAIVRFLDHANRKIDGFIRAKRKLIGLLNEQKQAIIHRAVTRGLHPDVPLKPSGIPWLGDIPAHWEVMQLRQVLSFGPKNGVSPQASTGTGVLSFSISAVRDGRINISGNEKIVELDSARVDGFRIHKGDILLVRGNGNVALVGKCGLVDVCPENCVYPDILMKLRPNEKMNAEFMVLVINSSYVTNQVSTLAKTSNGAFKVSRATVRSISMVVPRYDEQVGLVEAIGRDTATVTTAIARTEREIALMQEYRTRLTADLVTGKLDVREAAAQLPDPPAEMAAEPAFDEPLEEIETEGIEA